MSWFLVILFLSLTFASLSESSHHKKLPSAVVVGTVYCDTCSQQDFTFSSHFISGASVAIECKGSNSKPRFKNEVKTNEQGEFKVKLPFSVSKHAKRIKGCTFKLISSSEPHCAVASSATSSSLSLKSRKQGEHIFSAGFFSFKPLKKPNLCNQKPSIRNSKQKTQKFPPNIDPSFPPPLHDPPTPGILPPLPSVPGLTPLPQLPLPPLPEIPLLPPPPIQVKANKESKPNSKFSDKKFFFPIFPNPFQPPIIPNPFQPPPLIPNPFQPPPLIPNPFQPPSPPLIPNPFQPPSPPPLFPNPFQPPPSSPPPLFPNPFQPPPSSPPPLFPPLFPLPPIPGLTKPPPPPPPPPVLPFPFPPLFRPPHSPGSPPASSSKSTSSSP